MLRWNCNESISISFDSTHSNDQRDTQRVLSDQLIPVPLIHPIPLLYPAEFTTEAITNDSRTIDCTDERYRKSNENIIRERKDNGVQGSNHSNDDITIQDSIIAQRNITAHNIHACKDGGLAELLIVKRHAKVQADKEFMTALHSSSSSTSSGKPNKTNAEERNGTDGLMDPLSLYQCVMARNYQLSPSARTNEVVIKRESSVKQMTRGIKNQTHHTDNELNMLWAKKQLCQLLTENGLYLANGMRFGADYLVYEGLPQHCHAKWLLCVQVENRSMSEGKTGENDFNNPIDDANRGLGEGGTVESGIREDCGSKDECGIDPLWLIRHTRLATHVAKRLLLARAIEQQTEVDESDSSIRREPRREPRFTFDFIELDFAFLA